MFQGSKQRFIYNLRQFTPEIFMIKKINKNNETVRALIVANIKNVPTSYYQKFAVKKSLSFLYK